MEYQVKIHPALDTDMESVIRIFQEVFEEIYQSAAPDFAEVTAGEKIFAAELDGKIVGFLSLWEPDNFIHFLFVDRSARGQHVGTRLIQYTADHFGYPLSLKCLTRNEKALQYYESSGWKEKATGTSEDGEYVLLGLNNPNI